MYGDLGSFENRSEILELINKQALDDAIHVKGIPFDFALEGAENSSNEIKAIKAIWYEGKTGAEVWEDILGETKMPGRMKEWLELYNTGYYPPPIINEGIDIIKFRKP